MENKTYIIGFGSGRCGTMSLAKLLNACEDTCVLHEMKILYVGGGTTLRNQDRISELMEQGKAVRIHRKLSWQFNEQEAKEKMYDLQHINKSFVGEVAFYYLNSLSYFIKQLDAKCICLWREQEKVVNSFMKRTSKFHHWNSNPNKFGFRVSPYDVCFPSYDTLLKKEAIAKYWEEYYAIAEKLIEQFPNNIIKVDINHFNEKENQKRIFDFVGIPEQNRLYKEIKAN